MDIRKGDSVTVHRPLHPCSACGRLIAAGKGKRDEACDERWPLPEGGDSSSSSSSSMSSSQSSAALPLLAGDASQDEAVAESEASDEYLSLHSDDAAAGGGEEAASAHDAEEPAASVASFDAPAACALDDGLPELYDALSSNLAALKASNAVPISFIGQRQAEEDAFDQNGGERLRKTGYAVKLHKFLSQCRSTRGVASSSSAAAAAPTRGAACCALSWWRQRRQHRRSPKDISRPGAPERDAARRAAA